MADVLRDPATASPAPGSSAPAGQGRQSRHPAVQRALLIWPRLEGRAISRCSGDVHRIAAHIARRTSLPVESIRAMLLAERATHD